MSKIFEGVKVLDFTNNAAGPLTGSILADFGAEVIKVERPVVGDDVRGFAPRIEGEALQFMWLNRGKKSIEVALDDPEGIEIIKKIIPDMDVIVESFKPGVMKKFGLDYNSVAPLNPGIIYCSLSAFGQEGPYSKKPGYDLIAQGLSGLMDITGEKDGPPQKHGSIIGDYVGALNAYGSIAAALYHKQRTGEGQNVDVSLCEGLLAFNNTFEMTNIGLKPTRTGNHSNNLCPYGVFSGKDGQSIIVCAPNNKMWNRLCEAIGNMEAAEKYNTAAARMANIDKVIEVIEDFAKKFDDISEAVSILDKAGVPCCKVQTTNDLLTDEHFLARGAIVDLPTTDSLEAKGVKSIKARGPWNKLSKTPAVMGKAPVLGQHNYEIMQRYGVAKDKIEALEKKWSDRFKK